jgi:hypothetical protein
MHDSYWTTESQARIADCSFYVPAAVCIQSNNLRYPYPYCAGTFGYAADHDHDQPQILLHRREPEVNGKRPLTVEESEGTE